MNLLIRRTRLSVDENDDRFVDESRMMLLQHLDELNSSMRASSITYRISSEGVRFAAKCVF
jgi:hypothetical protein